MDPASAIVCQSKSAMDLDPDWLDPVLKLAPFIPNLSDAPPLDWSGSLTCCCLTNTYD